MGKIIKDTIHANGIDIGIYMQDFENEFLSLTDIARYKSDDPTAIIQNWMRNRDVIEFLGLWEKLHNPACFYNVTQEMDRSDRCYWHRFKSRTLRRNICP